MGSAALLIDLNQLPNENQQRPNSTQLQLQLQLQHPGAKRKPRRLDTVTVQVGTPLAIAARTRIMEGEDNAPPKITFNSELSDLSMHPCASVVATAEVDGRVSL